MKQRTSTLNARVNSISRLLLPKGTGGRPALARTKGPSVLGLMALTLALLTPTPPALAAHIRFFGGSHSEGRHAPPSAKLAEHQDALREKLRQHWEHMSPQEQDAWRQRLRQRWEDMPPEQRDTLREKLRERWRNMSPEERQQLRRDFRQGAGHYGRPEADTGP